MFLEECKYVVKQKKMRKYIIDDTEISSDSDEENSSEENFDEENADKNNSDKENSDEENQKIFLIVFFFCIYESGKSTLSNTQRNAPKKKHVKDIKILLKKKENKGFSIIRNVSKSYLSIEEII